MRDDQLQQLARVALAHDHDPVPWDDAPGWRRDAMTAVAKAAIGACGPTRADHAFSAWFLAMTLAGWRWGRVFSDKERTHPGIVSFGKRENPDQAGEGLALGFANHWLRLVDAVRDEARRIGVRITE